MLGRSKITRTWAAGTSVGKVFQDVCTDTGLSYSDVVAVAYKTISATTVTAESALSVMQSNLNTEQGLLFASGDSLLLYSRGWQQYTFFYNYSDAGGAAIEVVCGPQSPNATNRLAQLSRDLGLVASCGSDFHDGGNRWSRPGGFPPLPEDLTPVWTTWPTPSS